MIRPAVGVPWMGALGGEDDRLVLIGYARVSTPEQRLDLQRDALTKAGCERVFEEIASGAPAERRGLTAALAFVRPGDTLAVWKLDRLGRSLPHLIEAVTALREREIGFRSLQERLDTTTSGGKLVFHVFAALAEFERDLIRERTRAGLDAARARGRKGGRPRAMDARQVSMAVALYRDRKHTPQEICAALRISKTTLYRYLAVARADPTAPAPSLHRPP